MKYSITTFEWKGGLKNLLVTNFLADNDYDFELKLDVHAKVVNNRLGKIDANFHLNTQDRTVYNQAWKFANTLATSQFGGFSSQGMEYHFLIYPVNGEPLTVTVMKQLVRLLATCGIYTISAPRILTENFEGRTEDDKNGVPYGQTLLKQVMKEENERRSELHDPNLDVDQGHHDYRLKNTDGVSRSDVLDGIALGMIEPKQLKKFPG